MCCYRCPSISQAGHDFGTRAVEIVASRFRIKTLDVRGTSEDLVASSDFYLLLVSFVPQAIHYNMGFKSISKLRERAVLKADASQNEETTAWCNRDLVPVSVAVMNNIMINYLTANSCHQAEEHGAGSTSLAQAVCKS